MVIKDINAIAQIFHGWVILKIILWHKPNRVVFKQNEIWWCSLGMNVGEEVYGKGLKFARPVFIFRKFTTNSFLGIPLTGQENEGSWYVEIAQSGKKNWLMLNQARVLDKKRLISRITTLEKDQVNVVKARFLDFYSS